jgi:hypothetical protein
MRNHRTIFQRDVTNGYERKHVGRAQTRMHSLVGAHVDQPAGLTNHFHCRVHYIFAGRNKGDDGTVMVRIEMGVEHTRSLNRLNRFDQLVDHFRLAALTEVWYTLNERHKRDQMSEVRRQNLVPDARC